MKTLPKVPVHPDTWEKLRSLGRSLIDGCRATLPDGTAIWCPDAQRNYPGVWLRDFCYTVEGLGEMLDPADILAVADLFLAHQLDDGTIPTRVLSDGVPDYREGPREAPLGHGPPADNPQFLAKLLCAYVDLSGDWRAFADRLDAVDRALRSLPLDREGFVYIDPNLPRSSYGFTDCIAKTGRELFCSLLLWEAYRRLAETCRRWEMHEEAHDWYERAEALGRVAPSFYVAGWGMFAAASGDCRQIDLWGSVYACVLLAATGTQREAVASFLLRHYDRCFFLGHLRHLPAGEYWERMLADVSPGHYQNGGYWAVPAGWAAQVLATVDEGLAARLVGDLVAEFERYGVHEWVHPEHGRHVKGYIASLANVCAAVRPISRKRFEGAG